MKNLIVLHFRTKFLLEHGKQSRQLGWKEISFEASEEDREEEEQGVQAVCEEVEEYL